MLSVLADSTKHRIAVNLVCGRSRSVSFQCGHLCDRRVLSLMNLSYSWMMSLVLLAFRPVQTLRQRVPGS